MTMPKANAVKVIKQRGDYIQTMKYREAESVAKLYAVVDPVAKKVIARRLTMEECVAKYGRALRLYILRPYP